MALVFISAIVSPYNKAMLSAPQVLWIRLISDTFIATSAILDLRATPGSDREIRNRRRETYFTWTMTLSQATFQLTACLILYYASPSIFGDAPNQKPTPNTLVFNTLVWMQVFNLLK
jgi:magnesium-transporting ATPase (P-type)